MTEKRKIKTRRRRKPKYIKGPSVQYHHDQYDPLTGEEVGATAGHMFKGEHSHTTMLRRQTKNVSKWFIQCLKKWLTEAEALDESGLRPFRDLNQEITNLPEGKSWHCKWCEKGFLVRSNRDIHEEVCSKKEPDTGETS